MIPRVFGRRFFAYSSKQLIDLEAQYGCHNYGPLNVVAAKGKGALLWDVEGNSVSICRQAIFRYGWRYRSLQPGPLPPEDPQVIHRPGPETNPNIPSHLQRPTRPRVKEAPRPIRLRQVHIYERRRLIRRNCRKVRQKMGLQCQKGS